MKQFLENNILNDIKNKEKQIDILHALNLQRDENAYSDIIAKLFSSQYGASIIKLTLDLLSGKKYKIPKISKIQSIFVKREYFRIDILIIVNDSLIICFENKVDAWERDNQISDYQNVLKKYYDVYEIIFIFLTPDGRDAISHDKRFSNCYPLSYNDLLTILDNASIQIGNEDFRSYIHTFRVCIEEELTMNTKELHEISKIWGNSEYRKKINILLQHKPTLSNVTDKLFDELNKWVKENFKDQLNYEVYPTKGEMKEFKISSNNFDKAGIPLVFMFYDSLDEDCVTMRLVFWKDDVNKKLEKRLALFNNKGLETMKNPNWYSLYSGKKYIADYEFTENHDYGDSLIKIMIKAFKKEYCIMNDFINNKFI